MRNAALLMSLLAACGSPSSGGGDDDGTDANPGDSNGTPDGPVMTVDPAWPADSPLPPEFDFPPYLNLMNATTVTVSWRTVSSSTGTVKFGTTDAYGSELSSSTAANVHHVELTNLAPATAYYYEVSITGTTATRKGVFVTPGATNWRFLALGEYHAPSESSGVARFSEEIRAFRPHVAVESGDMVDDGDDLTHWRSYLRTAAPWVSNVLLLPAHSNHVDGSGGNDNLMDFFVLPNNERWYVTRYGQVQFFTIDSHESGNSDIATVEVPWLRTAAAEAHDGTDDPTFVIAMWHHPGCSSQYASRASSRNWVQSNLVKAFKDNGGVDLILAAHDKYYERSTITGGITHVITNIGNISPEIPGFDHADCTVAVTNRDTRSTALITVEGSTLTAKVIDEDDAQLDTFTITK